MTGDGLSPAGAVVVGGLWGGEDRWHRPVQGDAAYRESYYFDFADEHSELVGFTSVGWKPQRGALGATTVLFDESGAWMNQAQRTTSGDFPLLAVDGLSYRQAGDALGSWDVDFAGSMALTPELGTQARNPGAAHPLDVRLHVGFRPQAPEVCTTGLEYDRAFRWHLEQSGYTEGHVDLGSAAPRRAFQGRGHRDRSFGARDWTHFDCWVYLAGHTSEVTLNLWALQGPDGAWVMTGWVQHTGRAPEAVRRYRLTPGDMLDAGDDRVPAFLDFELSGESGVVTGTAESARLIPLGFTTRWGAARLDRGVGSYVINGQPGTGQVEYQQRVDRAFSDARWRLDGS